MWSGGLLGRSGWGLWCPAGSGPLASSWSSGVVVSRWPVVRALLVQVIGAVVPESTGRGCCGQRQGWVSQFRGGGHPKIFRVCCGSP